MIKVSGQNCPVGLSKVDGSRLDKASAGVPGQSLLAHPPKNVRGYTWASTLGSLGEPCPSIPHSETQIHKRAFIGRESKQAGQ